MVFDIYFIPDLHLEEGAVFYDTKEIEDTSGKWRDLNVGVGLFTLFVIGYSYM